MYRIGVISDTHGLLREEVKKELTGCDAILHGGDIHKPEILQELKKTAPVYAVRGNADKEWAEGLPKFLEIELYGISIFMIHNRKELPEAAGHADLVVFGHSHKYMDRIEKGVRYLNPGSCGPRRFRLPVTMAVIETEGGGSYKVKRMDLCKNLPEVNIEMPKEEKFGRELILKVMRDVNKGKSVKQIARENSISEELAESICRMYLTHPGVSVDGIMDRVTQAMRN